ncbi:MAG: hypothetical protein MR419_08790 [Clostridiales bacterium]|nr:hypothetical protein [Clostridiales bacterium]MDY4172243.1 hypothetical protein [Evtepia sp.]
MKKAGILLAILLIVTSIGVVAYSSDSSPVEAELGTYYEEATERESSTSDTVAATYKEEKVMMSVVEYQKQTQAALAGSASGETVSDREIVDDILKNVILLEEAENRGLTPSTEEVEQYLQETVYAAYELPEGKEGIDAYCANAGITYDEYVDDQRAQAPKILAKWNLKEAIAKEYCQNHGLTYDRLNPPQEALDAVEEYLSSLLDEHKDDIIYYID